ncbi:hypothetical protein L9F63_015646, partial [Diploptera punctata]
FPIPVPLAPSVCDLVNDPLPCPSTCLSPRPEPRSRKLARPRVRAHSVSDPLRLRSRERSPCLSPMTEYRARAPALAPGPSPARENLHDPLRALSSVCDPKSCTSSLPIFYEYIYRIEEILRGEEIISE